MIETIENVYDSGKKSLDSLIREKAYKDVRETLSEKDIDIDSVSDEDIETLVAAKVNDMTNEIKGIGKATAFAIAISLLTGV
jgi:hypothetical protein